MKRLAIVAAMPLVLGLALLVPVSQGQDKDKDKDPPAAEIPIRADGETSESEVLAELLRDPVFDRYVDLRRVAGLVEQKNAAELADMAFQLAEGERILLRPHNAATSATVFNLALRVAAENQDKETLARLAKAAEKAGDQERVARVTMAQKLAGKARSIDPVLKEGTREALDAIDTSLKIIQESRQHVDKLDLDELEEDLVRLPINDKQRDALKKLIAEARDAQPLDPGAAVLLDLAGKLGGGSRTHYDYYFNYRRLDTGMLYKMSFTNEAQARADWNWVRSLPQFTVYGIQGPPTIVMWRTRPKYGVAIDRRLHRLPAGTKIVQHLLSENGAALIGQDGASLIGQDGASLIGDNGSGITNVDVVEAIKSMINQKAFLHVPRNIIGLNDAGLIGVGVGSLTGYDPLRWNPLYSGLSTVGGVPNTRVLKYQGEVPPSTSPPPKTTTPPPKTTTPPPKTTTPPPAPPKPTPTPIDPRTPPLDEVVPLMAAGNNNFGKRHRNLHHFEAVIRNGAYLYNDYQLKHFVPRYEGAMFAAHNSGYLAYARKADRKLSSTMYVQTKWFDCDKKENVPSLGVGKLIEYMTPDNRALIDLLAGPHQGTFNKVGFRQADQVYPALQEAINKALKKPGPWRENYVPLGFTDYLVRANVIESRASRKCLVWFAIEPLP